ncbi:putative reverse transcriptase domain-containing protein, partial [Tanacetum coccineum]
VESGIEARGNHQNQVVAVNGGQGHGNNSNKARGRAFMLGVEESCQDPNIMTASGQLVEIDKVINGYKLEIEGYVFDINLIPFGSESFDMIIGMDWLSNHKAEIICHEKVVRIPLPDDKLLRVIGKRSEEKIRHLRSAKTKEQKQEEIVMVRDYPKVFLDDLSGLPPNQEIECCIELIPGAIPVAKSPYRLAPSEREELSGKLKQLQDKGYYHRFMENFSKIAKPLTVLTQKSKTFDWGEEQENAFQTLKGKLCDAPVPALLDRPKYFVVFCDASGLGLGYVLMQRGTKKKGLDEMIEHRSDGALYYLDRIWVPLKGDVRTLIMDEAHKLKYSVHPGADKMYYDLRDRPSGLLQQPEISEWKWEGIAMDFVMKSPRTSSGHDTIWVIVD